MRRLPGNEHHPAHSPASATGPITQRGRIPSVPTQVGAVHAAQWAEEEQRQDDDDVNQQEDDKQAQRQEDGEGTGVTTTGRTGEMILILMDGLFLK